MNQTTILFLKSYLPRDKFQEALTWVKAQPKRLFLGDSKIWVLDTETTPTDPGWRDVIEGVTQAGWKVVGESLWDVERPLADNKVALEALAGLAVEREEQANARRHAHRSGGRTW